MKFDSIRILCFSAVYCGICRGVEKAGVVEKFADKHFPPKMTQHKLVCADKDGEPSTDEFKKNFAISDAYGVEAFPTFIIEGKLKDGTGYEIARVDSSTVSAFTVKEFDRVYKVGLAEVDELPDDVESQDAASKRISW
jgi:hypothetical protein